MSRLSYARLKELLIYDAATGWFTRRTTSGRWKAGTRAGALRPDGYWTYNIDGHPYRGARLAWLYVTGEWPEGDVDHRDTNRANDAWENLRAASRSQNLANAKLKPKSTSGVKGASYHRRARRWAGYIRQNGKTIYLGLFDTAADAHAAYVAKAEELYGEFARAA